MSIVYILNSKIMVSKAQVLDTSMLLLKIEGRMNLNFSSITITGKDRPTFPTWYTKIILLRQ